MCNNNMLISSNNRNGGERMKLQQLFDSGFTFLEEENGMLWLEHPDTGCIVKWDSNNDTYSVVWSAWDT